MKLKDLRPFVPSKDYEQSKAFYLALGFNLEEAGPDLCILIKDQCTFFLQRYYNEEFASNLMFQLVVYDIDDVMTVISSVTNIEMKHSPIKNEPWGKVIYLWGPAGELWHITELNR
ncbi:lactoylglutathione lyase [Halioxenophilus aromaticivorans]|uniref:VOC family protein n=1 Tax=Halioxenophilus aromaticivorans TaxID=1306992 RepID=A0AAV3TWR1_9ALTE